MGQGVANKSLAALDCWSFAAKNFITIHQRSRGERRMNSIRFVEEAYVCVCAWWGELGEESTDTETRAQ